MPNCSESIEICFVVFVLTHIEFGGYRLVVPRAQFGDVEITIMNCCCNCL